MQLQWHFSIKLLDKMEGGGGVLLIISQISSKKMVWTKKSMNFKRPKPFPELKEHIILHIIRGFLNKPTTGCMPYSSKTIPADMEHLLSAII